MSWVINQDGKGPPVMPEDDALAGLTERQRRLFSVVEAQAKTLLVEAFTPVQQELASAVQAIEQRVERELAVIAEHVDEALGYLARKD
jgi:hypothetical protein